MRKFAVFFLTLLSALGLSACGNANQSDIPVTEIDMPESRTGRNAFTNRQ